MSKGAGKVVFPIDDDLVYDEIIDVRAPGEFADDHISGAINLPVLDDRERETVGTIYKQDSPFEARKIGAAMVSANISRHIEAHFLTKDRGYRPLVYCWRGGQRSGSLATVLSDIGFPVSLVRGGYKTYRSHVVETIARIAPELKLVVLNGYTGAGKTLVLEAIAERGEQVIDLEGLARHKGSVFGGDPDDPQPAQKRFESLLFDRIGQLDLDRPVYIEAESAKIGRLNLPNPLWQQLKASPVIELDTPVAARAEFLSEDYEEWIDNLERVHATIDRLAGFHANETLASWKKMTEAGEWLPFVTELLEQHYDKKYTVDGSGNYPVPSARVRMPSHEFTHVARAAVEIIEIGPTLLP